MCAYSFVRLFVCLRVLFNVLFYVFVIAFYNLNAYLIVVCVYVVCCAVYKQGYVVKIAALLLGLLLKIVCIYVFL